jgi:cytochrome P450
MITPPGDISVLSLSRYGFFSAIVLILGIYAIIQRFRQILAFREFGSINGCAEIPNRRQKWWKLGIDTIYESYRWKKQHSYLELLQKNFDDYGKTYSSRVLGTNKLTTMDPANVEAILKTKWEDFIARPARKIPLDGLVGPGVLTADGALWKQHRKLMMPSFSRKALEDLSIYAEHFDRFMYHVPRDGQIVDLQDLFFKLTMDSSTAHLLGCSSRTLASTSELTPEPELAGAFDRAQRAAVEKFALGWADRLRPQPQYWKDTALVWNFAQRYVDIALKRKQARTANAAGKITEDTKKTNFLDEICGRTEDSDDIHKGALHLLVAGRDSTASLLSNLWFMLARDKRVWQKLKEEIDTLKGAVPDNDMVKGMPYLRNCINECKFESLMSIAGVLVLTSSSITLSPSDPLESPCRSQRYSSSCRRRSRRSISHCRSQRHNGPGSLVLPASARRLLGSRCPHLLSRTLGN